MFAEQKRRPARSYTSRDLVLITKPNQKNKNAGNVIPSVKDLRRRGRPVRIIKPSSPTPVNAQIHKGSQNSSSVDPWSGRLRGQRGRLQPMVLRTKPKQNQQMALSAIRLTTRIENKNTLTVSSTEE
ncbi:hypothetical protein NPIL_22721 [Nephila pilipes]|uniref:Uncharacterized protein n=1 Tax=Nephila pilipes TaxID=299642 RepID=A0A8X6I6Q2_NEPPI|nr:hypothetical protein NPIL_22721 [Nephila pilipes]